MAEEYNLPSDSDDSDADFKPDEESLPSEEDSDGSVEEPALDNEESQNIGKRKKKQSKHRKKIKKNSTNDIESDENPNEKEDVKKLSAEEEKRKTDSLWNDFMKDCLPPVRKSTPAISHTEEVKESKTLPTKSPLTENENKAIVTEIFEFAGEKIKVEKEVTAEPSGREKGGLVPGRGRSRGGGLSALIGQLGKKNKLSTLEKSKMDWDRFKKEEGIEEDLQTFNKGKEGYLEKQDFLQRTDLRQFEIEKQLRTTSRSNR